MAGGFDPRNTRPAPPPYLAGRTKRGGTAVTAPPCRRQNPLPLLALLAPLLATGAGLPVIRVDPAAIRMERAEGRQQVAVSVVQPDGLARDATTSARFSVVPTGVAEVSTSGLVVARSAGTATLRVE